ncbi:MAG: hypothetical protein [Wendovervirus sonii]|uniref:Uncharacterized protein n=1 Tax=phage Lak_Megaphage_Sonny TaxID=3109229 RepID=A0ABZ0Z2F5_9CAUD|nr:MAG: hypothetical protein [phage Lak_Megaphage_Sonny]
MENDYTVYKAKVGEAIKNEFDEKWIKVGSDNSAYDKAQKAITKINKKFQVEVLSVVEVNDGEYYLGFYAGGLNGGGPSNKWCLYLDEMKKILGSFEHSWIIDLVNDCCDDIWYLTIGFN